MSGFTDSDASATPEMHVSVCVPSLHEARGRSAKMFRELECYIYSTRSSGVVGGGAVLVSCCVTDTIYQVITNYHNQSNWDCGSLNADIFL